MASEYLSAGSGISFGISEGGSMIMRVPTEEYFDAEHLGEVIEIILRQPNTDSEILKGVKVTQGHMHHHAAELCHHFGYTDQSKRDAWLSENMEKVKRFAVYMQGLIESSSRGWIVAAFLAELAGKRLVDKEEEVK